MSRLVTILITTAVTALFAAAPAQARGGHWHGGWHRGGLHHFHGGFRGFGWGWPGPYPYYGGYYAPYYYAGPPACDYYRVRVWRRHHWVLRRVWRCW